MTMFVKTQDGVPSCVNTVHLVEISPIKLHHLFKFDGASDVVNEEDQEAAPTSISMVLTVPRDINSTSLVPGPRTQREGAQRSFP